MLTLDDYRETAAALLRQGAPLSAYDAVADGLRHFPGDPQLRRLLALALARTGASRQANALLQALVADGQHDEETVGMLARTYKDLGGRTSGTAARRHLEEAFRWYFEAHRRTGGYWSGINAATMALILGDDERSRDLARAVRDRCTTLLAGDASPSENYWLLATLGEAQLLLRDLSAAESFYRQAVARGRPGLGDVVSTRRNARLILRHGGLDAAPIEACFRVPRVAVFAGHLIDRPGRSEPRFPPALEEDVRRALSERIRTHHIGIGYASAGNGGDILFLESLLEAGASLHIVLPYNREQFIQDSVAFVPGATWSDRCDAVLARAAQVTTASEQRMLGGAMSYEYGFLLLDGMAALRADELDTDLLCLAVWDGRSGDGPGGTAASVEHWRRANRTLDIIDLRSLADARLPVTVSLPRGAADEPIRANDSRVPDGPEAFEARLVGILIADVAGFTKLKEEQIPRFVEHYLGLIRTCLLECREPPLLCNTWGDGLYVVFPSVQEAGLAALRLSEAIAGNDWGSLGLPGTLNLRLALHAGPVYACHDPVTDRPNYLGAHVALAARIEPVTPPGEVYASGAFAALARATQVTEFECAYVGQLPLAKGFGTFPIYVLHPTR